MAMLNGDTGERDKQGSTGWGGIVRRWMEMLDGKTVDGELFDWEAGQGEVWWIEMLDEDVGWRDVFINILHSDTGWGGAGDTGQRCWRCWMGRQ